MMVQKTGRMKSSNESERGPRERTEGERKKRRRARLVEAREDGRGSHSY